MLMEEDSFDQISLQALFNGQYSKDHKGVRSFARYFGIYYEWLLVPWISKQGEILAGPGMEGMKGIEVEPKRPRVRLNGRNLDYDWLVKDKDSKLILLESKSWIAYTNFKTKFEENDFKKRFQEKCNKIKSGKTVSENIGLYCFICHPHSRDFKVIAPRPKSYQNRGNAEREINKRWLLWWDTDAGKDGKTCEFNKELSIFSVRDIMRNSWCGIETGEFGDFLERAYVKPLEAALNVIKLGVEGALQAEKKEG